MESVIRIVSPRVADNNGDSYKHLTEQTSSAGPVPLQDLGFTPSEMEESISTHEVSQVDVNNVDKRREMSFSQGKQVQNQTNEEKKADAEAKRYRELSPSPPHVMPSLLLFSPTPRKMVAAMTPSDRSRAAAVRTPSTSSVLRLASFKIGSPVNQESTSVGSPNLTPSVEASRFQSVWKFDDNGRMIRTENDDEKVGESVQLKDVDLIKALQDGTVLLKFGAKGQPHFRFFVVDSKRERLIWMSGTKTFESTQLAVKDIEDIKFGLGDKALRVKGAKSYQNLGFTIVYNEGQSSLELMAKDAEELQIWVNGLIVLRNAAMNKEEAPKSFFMTISPNEQHPILFGKSVSGGEAKATQSEINKLERRFNKLAAETEVVVVPFADVVTSRVSAGMKQLKESLDIASPSLSSSSVDSLNYQMWLLAVQVEALEHILRTPRQVTPRPVISPLRMDSDE
eukprot:TRINITY_DN2084_c0_g1_i1.p1 TRINITY_DN2084_c0_g1~~TRINITY_DN2084_c0_g1_i1.p1  ORF type:complete len:453 (+),score=153.13 TRINITY_DN2084_c0_g1_i1:86-1444(+)